MKFYEAPHYTQTQLDGMTEKEVHFPFSDDDAVYIGRDHQYELTAKYFTQRGVNLSIELEGNDPEKVKHFLRDLRMKVYLYIYTHSKSPRVVLNFIIARRGIRGYSLYEYRQAFLEAMFLEGCYMLRNGDVATIAGVDFDQMASMPDDVLRAEDRDMHKDAVRALQILGLSYYGQYRIMPCGMGVDW